MKLHRIVTFLTLMPGMAIAALDRGGNVLYEDGDGGGVSLSNMLVMAVACFGVGWLAKVILDWIGYFTPEGTATASVWIGLLGGALIAAMLFR